MYTIPRAALRNAAAIASLSLFAGCADLSFITADECGNGVLEEGERCDGEADCGAPGTATACQIVCVEGACRDGYACGLDGICRAPSGLFEIVRASATPTALDLFAGDINQDGCGEIYVSTRQGISMSAFESAKAGACPAQEQEIPTGRAPEKELIRPSAQLADINGDGRPDLIRASAAQYGDGLFIDVAGASPALASVLYPTLKTLEYPTRSLRVTVLGKDALVLLLDQPMGSSTIGVAGVLDPLNTPFPTGTGLPGVMADLAVVAVGDTNTANPMCDPCDEVLTGFAGQGQILSFSLSTGKAPNGMDVLKSSPAMPVITLPPGAILRGKNASIALIDHNGDDHLDVIVNTEAGGPGSLSPLYIAYGTGKGTFHSQSPPNIDAPDGKAAELPLPAQDPMAPNPKAADVIFVAADFGQGVQIAAIPCPGSEAVETIACNATLAKGCEAVVYDTDGDGLLDIVATEEQEPGLTVRRSTASGGFHTSFVDTSCPPHQLATGDFDGDGIGDLAFFDQTFTGSLVTGNGERPVDTLMVAYGNAFAPAGEPLASGQLANAAGLISGRFSPGAVADQLYATRALDEEAKTGFALVEGYGERQLFSPYYFPFEPEPGMEGPGAPNIEPASIVGGTIGQFSVDADGKPVFAIAAITREMGSMPPGPMESAPLLRLLDARNEGSSLVGGEANESPDCTNCMLAAINVPECDGEGGPDELLLMGKDQLIVYSVTLVAGPKEGTQVNAFKKCASFDAGGHAFSFADATTKPEKYVPRPIVVDLDHDGRMDVLARDEKGDMVALWGRSGGFDITTLSFPSRSPAISCGGKCSVARAPLTAESGKEQLFLAAPGGLVRYAVGADRSLEELPLPDGLSAMTPDAFTDFTAVAMPDLDGDGLSDLVIMPSSGLVVALRSLPEDP